MQLDLLQIDYMREVMRAAMADPRHPYHARAVKIPDLVTVDAETLVLFRRVGPYLFEEDGRVLGT